MLLQPKAFYPWTISNFAITKLTQALILSRIPLRRLDFAVEKSTCLTPCAAIRANSLVPIRTSAAKNGISIFTGFISSSDCSQGKACAKDLDVRKRAHKWRESRTLPTVALPVIESGDAERQSTCGHP